jgi:thiol-disulfide isomerase/thioredoxin
MFPMLNPDINAKPPARRRWALGALAATALGAGIGASWWRNRPAPKPAPDGLWARQWTSPQGQTFAMQSFRGRPLLINFWATWCPPCIEELPLIEAFYQQNKANGWQVLGLAVDKQERVQTFLGNAPVSFPIGMAGLEGTELSRALGNVTGSLPFTVVFTSDGQIAQRKLGLLHQQDLDQWRSLR